MSEIPEEAVQAAIDGVDHEYVDRCGFDHNAARAALTAAAPILAKQARADERRKVAEEIAEAITRSVCDPPRACANRACTDCARYMQAQEDAIIARRIGEACDAR